MIREHWFNWEPLKCWFWVERVVRVERLRWWHSYGCQHVLTEYSGSSMTPFVLQRSRPTPPWWPWDSIAAMPRISNLSGSHLCIWSNISSLTAMFLWKTSFKICLTPENGAGNMPHKGKVSSGKSGYLISIPRPHIVESKNWQLTFALWPPHKPHGKWVDTRARRK